MFVFFYCLSSAERADCPCQRTGFIKLQVMLSLSLFANSAGVCGNGLSENSCTSWVRRVLGMRDGEGAKKELQVCAGQGLEARLLLLCCSPALLCSRGSISMLHRVRVTAGGSLLGSSSIT